MESPIQSQVREVPRCVVCGGEILHRRKDAKTCLAHAGRRPGHKSGPSGKVRDRPVNPRRFVSLDGEATTKDGKYGLLATSDGFYLQNRNGLTTEECLDFLLQLPKHSERNGGKPIYVGFAIDYDVNMILGDLPLKGEESSIEELRAKGFTRWRGYTITYYHRKIFRVSRGKRTLTWYDTWGYFQSSFENALKGWDIPTPAIITEGKAARGGFHKWPMEKIREYNAAELAGHVELMNRLRDAIRPLNLRVQSWHGPAALAGYWLRANSVKEYQGEELSPNMLDVASRAYFGGRIDVRGFGFVDPCYHYDIVSAYPAATRYLPNLSNLTWKRHARIPEGSRLYVARIRWEIDRNAFWSPFPWRDRDGTILYPTEGEGWYWMPELEVARQRFGDCYQVLECYAAEGELTFPLRNLIEETFRYRAELKAEGNPSHVPVKLILNSIYGKFAQQVGRATYRNMIWAGLITSYTRAELMRVLPDDAVVVMTDSIWTPTPLPDEVVTGGLGGWELQPENRLVVAEAGLYKAWSPEDPTPSTWQRGFDKRYPVDIEGIVRCWLLPNSEHPDWKSELYFPSYKVHRFIGMGLASMTSYPWREWRDIEREIHPVPMVGTTKRWPSDFAGIREGDFMSLFLKPMDEDECSSPYKGMTVDPSLIIERLEDECDDEDY